MNNIFKYSFTAFIVVAILCFPAFRFVQAVGLPFGGLVDYVGYGECDCPITEDNVPMYFSPTNDYPKSITILPLVYSPEFTLQVYNNHIIPLEGVQLLGQYIPGIPACLYYIPPYECGYVPVQGVITMVGTSL